MKSKKNGILVCLVFISLMIPTSAFATDLNNTYYEEDGFWSNIYSVFSFLQSDKEINYTNYSTGKENNTNIIVLKMMTTTGVTLMT